MNIPYLRIIQRYKLHRLQFWGKNSVNTITHSPFCSVYRGSGKGETEKLKIWEKKQLNEDRKESKQTAHFTPHSTPGLGTDIGMGS